MARNATNTTTRIRARNRALPKLAGKFGLAPDLTQMIQSPAFGSVTGEQLASIFNPEHDEYGYYQRAIPEPACTMAGGVATRYEYKPDIDLEHVVLQAAYRGIWAIILTPYTVWGLSQCQLSGKTYNRFFIGTMNGQISTFFALVEPKEKPDWFEQKHSIFTKHYRPPSRPFETSTEAKMRNTENHAFDPEFVDRHGDFIVRLLEMRVFKTNIVETATPEQEQNMNEKWEKWNRK